VEFDVFTVSYYRQLQFSSKRKHLDNFFLTLSHIIWIVCKACEVGQKHLRHNLWGRNKKKICNIIKNQMCRYMTDGLSTHLRCMFLG